MILAFAYETASGAKVPSDEAEERDGKFYRKGSKDVSEGTGEELKQIIAKMSKNLKNVVNPERANPPYAPEHIEGER